MRHDRRVCAGLAEGGWEVLVATVAAPWPVHDDAGAERSERSVLRAAVRVVVTRECTRRPVLTRYAVRARQVRDRFPTASGPAVAT